MINDTIQPTGFFPEVPNITLFEAETSLTDKISRIANYVIFAGAACGVYFLATLSITPLAIASYVMIALAARKIIAVVIGYMAYSSARNSLWLDHRASLEAEEAPQIENLRQSGFKVQHVKVYKSGIEYDARLITHRNTDPRKWTLHALGRPHAMESYIERLAREDAAFGSSTLLVNPASVGKSKGWPTSYQLGAGVEACIQLIEKKFNPTHIRLDSVSLGGGVLSQAILNHEFTDERLEKTQYMVVSRITFSMLSHIAKIFYPLASIFCTLAGMDLDGIGAAKLLSEKRIKHIIVQGEGSDKVIHDTVALANHLRQHNITDHKVFIESPEIKHAELPHTIKNQVDEHIQNFFDNIS